eukprot:TRINITY_DN54066_c0_g1_i1.p1 TRINITY_DN54066_c0_g1~~TRINITY_DN54066_c0_g1_i1.p1  ORF type:complete len:648 (+),score=181.05 TRINITY_DN54066_c0_g1_i1:129-1946(+)
MDASSLGGGSHLSPPKSASEVRWESTMKPLNPLDVIGEAAPMRSFAAMLDSPNNQRRMTKRMQMMEEKATKRASEFEEKYMTDKKNFFFELEHYRRGVTKALEQLSHYMSAGAFHAFKMSLQLDVRFLSEHQAEKEISGHGGGPTISTSGLGAFNDPGSPKDYSRIIKKLEEQLAEAEREIKRLQTELRKKQFGGVGAPGASGGGALKPTRNTEMQTMPMEDNGGGFRFDGGGGADRDEDPRKKKAKGHGGPGGAGGGSHDDDDDDGPGGAGRKGKKGKGGAGDDGGDNSAEIDRLTAERDRERRLRRELEAKVKELEELISSLRKQIRDLEEANSAKFSEIEKLKARIAALEDALSRAGVNPATVVAAETGKKGAGGGGGAGGDDDEAKKKKAKKSPSARRSSTSGGSGPDGGRERGGGRGGQRPSQDAEALAAAAAALAAKMAVETADACVGNGPGYGLQDEPVQCKAKALRPPEELNTSGKVYVTRVRTEPELGSLMGATLKSLSTSSLGSAKTPLLPKKKQLVSSSSWNSSTRFGSPSAKQAEPYLYDVWERFPTLHSSPSRTELIKLGATAPEGADWRESTTATMSPARARAALRSNTCL